MPRQAKDAGCFMRNMLTRRLLIERAASFDHDLEIFRHGARSD